MAYTTPTTKSRDGTDVVARPLTQVETNALLAALIDGNEALTAATEYLDCDGEHKTDDMWRSLNKIRTAITLATKPDGV